MSQELARLGDAPTVVCGAEAFRCICDESPGHEGPHLCKCQGSWHGTIDTPDFVVVQFPVGLPS